MLLRAYGLAEHPMPEKSVTYVSSTSVTHVGAMNSCAQDDIPCKYRSAPVVTFHSSLISSAFFRMDIPAHSGIFILDQHLKIT